MEDGRKITEGAQYKAAKKKQVKIISDLDLMKMVSDSIEKKEESGEKKEEEEKEKSGEKQATTAEKEGLKKE